MAIEDRATGRRWRLGGSEGLRARLLRMQTEALHTEALRTATVERDFRGDARPGDSLMLIRKGTA